ncbi:MAG: glycosyltransferase family 39 protein [Acidobacteria bacterium]|nr:glycosyltransferase family 39 protein [Acidobacteriota bacterium]MBK8810382.1 glycosyltransferase family 39 protein [Acidobacteriota bacterium]
MTKDTPNRKTLYFALGFTVLIVAVYLTGLSIPLLGPDEPRYTQVAREMFERGDWVTPKLGGFDWFEKPALLYWLQIASFHIFGVSEFGARFGSALFGLGTVFFLWLFGRSVGAAEGRDFAKWLALISASSLGLMVFSRGASFDIILTFPIAAALVSFFIWDERTRCEESGGGKYLALFYVFTGVSLIAKGLVGIVFPYAIVAFYFVLSRRMPSRSLIISLFWGTLLCVIVAGAWYFPMYRDNGWKFVDEFFIQHHFQRYTSNKYLHPQPFWFFWVVFPLMTFPWLPFFLGSVWTAVSGLFRRNEERPTRKPFVVFAFAWMLVPLVFFSFSGSKLPGYVLPALPAALILTAIPIVRFVGKSALRRNAVVSIAILMLVTVAILARFVVADFIREETVWHLVATANERGYRTEKIINMHAISHSAEFYGAGRLVRESDGKQRKFFGVSEILEHMDRTGSDQVLVIVPQVYLYTLMKPELIRTEVLDDNGEMVIAIVKRNR